MSRPLKQINWDIVEKRMEAGCNAREIALSIPCEINTFYDRFKNEYGKPFADYRDDFYNLGNDNIKFTQYMKALSGNIQMLLLLGRVRLGQDKEIDKIIPYNEILELRHDNMLLKAQLDKIKEVADCKVSD